MAPPTRNVGWHDPAGGDRASAGRGGMVVSKLAADTDARAPKSASQKLAELVARRKAAGGRSGQDGVPGPQRSERAAAARSASKSKPALRKG